MSLLLRHLESQGLVSPGDLEVAARRQQNAGGSLDTALLELGLLTPTQLDDALRDACGLPSAPVRLLERGPVRPWDHVPKDLVDIGWAIPLLAEAGQTIVAVHPDLPDAKLGQLYRQIRGFYPVVAPECCLAKVAAERSGAILSPRYALVVLDYLQALRRRDSGRGDDDDAPAGEVMSDVAVLRPIRAPAPSDTNPVRGGSGKHPSARSAPPETPRPLRPAQDPVRPAPQDSPPTDAGAPPAEAPARPAARPPVDPGTADVPIPRPRRGVILPGPDARGRRLDPVSQDSYPRGRTLESQGFEVARPRAPDDLLAGDRPSDGAARLPGPEDISAAPHERLPAARLPVPEDTRSAREDAPARAPAPADPRAPSDAAARPTSDAAARAHVPEDTRPTRPASDAAARTHVPEDTRPATREDSRSAASSEPSHPATREDSRSAASAGPSHPATREDSPAASAGPSRPAARDDSRSAASALPSEPSRLAAPEAPHAAARDDDGRSAAPARPEASRPGAAPDARPSVPADTRSARPGAAHDSRAAVPEDTRPAREDSRAVPPSDPSRPGATPDARAAVPEDTRPTERTAAAPDAPAVPEATRSARPSERPAAATAAQQAVPEDTRSAAASPRPSARLDSVDPAPRPDTRPPSSIFRPAAPEDSHAASSPEDAPAAARPSAGPGDSHAAAPRRAADSGPGRAAGDLRPSATFRPGEEPRTGPPREAREPGPADSTPGTRRPLAPPTPPPGELGAPPDTNRPRPLDPQRRRSGPSAAPTVILPLAQRLTAARAALAGARERDRITEALVRAAAIIAPRVGLFGVKREGLRVLGAPGSALRLTEGLVIPLPEGGQLDRAVTGQAPLTLLTEPSLSFAVGQPLGIPCIFEPVLASGRTVLMLYVDRAGVAFDPAERAAVRELCDTARQSLEALLRLLGWNIPAPPTAGPEAIRVPARPPTLNLPLRPVTPPPIPDTHLGPDAPTAPQLGSQGASESSSRIVVGPELQPRSPFTSTIVARKPSEMVAPPPSTPPAEAADAPAPSTPPPADTAAPEPPRPEPEVREPPPGRSKPATVRTARARPVITLVNPIRREETPAPPPATKGPAAEPFGPDSPLVARFAAFAAADDSPGPEDIRRGDPPETDARAASDREGATAQTGTRPPDGADAPDSAAPAAPGTATGPVSRDSAASPAADPAAPVAPTRPGSRDIDAAAAPTRPGSRDIDAAAPAAPTPSGARDSAAAPASPTPPRARDSTAAAGAAPAAATPPGARDSTAAPASTTTPGARASTAAPAAATPPGARDSTATAAAAPAAATSPGSPDSAATPADAASPDAVTTSDVPADSSATTTAAGPPADPAPATALHMPNLIAPPGAKGAGKRRAEPPPAEPVLVIPKTLRRSTSMTASPHPMGRRERPPETSAPTPADPPPTLSIPPSLLHPRAGRRRGKNDPRPDPLIALHMPKLVREPTAEQAPTDMPPATGPNDPVPPDLTAEAPTTPADVSPATADATTPAPEAPAAPADAPLEAAEATPPPAPPAAEPASTEPPAPQVEVEVEVESPPETPAPAAPAGTAVAPADSASDLMVLPAELAPAPAPPEDPLDAYLRDPEDEAALTRLRALDPAVLARLAARFPGPIDLANATNFPAPSAHGPLLRACVALGPAVTPTILELFTSQRPQIRFYAAFLFQELRDPRCMRALADLSLDPDPDVRLIATRVLESYGRAPEFHAVAAKIRAELDSPDRERQVIAAEAVGTLRDTAAVPRLIDLLAFREKQLREAALEALCSITAKHHGYRAARWRSWYAEHGHESRIEWVIEGLRHRDVAVRRWAADELVRVTGERIVFPPDGDKRSREIALRQWLDWWDAHRDEFPGRG